MRLQFEKYSRHQHRPEWKLPFDDKYGIHREPLTSRMRSVSLYHAGVAAIVGEKKTSASGCQLTDVRGKGDASQPQQNRHKAVYKGMIPRFLTAWRLFILRRLPLSPPIETVLVYDKIPRTWDRLLRRKRTRQHPDKYLALYSNVFAPKPGSWHGQTIEEKLPFFFPCTE